MIEEKNKTGLSALSLRWLALILMLIDHAGYAIGKPIHPAMFFYMHCVGRLAYPIFAFQIAEGCFHTSNWKRYALRLAVFGVISEIPFNMLHTGLGFFDPAHQNVMFTLLLGLVMLRLFLAVRQRNMGYKLLAMLVFAAVYLLAEELALDYGGLGVATVVMFGLSRDMKYKTLIQTLCLFLLNFALVLSHGTFEAPVQLLAVFAMLPICLYNGTEGKKNKILQYCAYLFYPAHISVLVILRYLVVKLV